LGLISGIKYIDYLEGIVETDSDKTNDVGFELL